jgi:hypothetical protein
MDVFKDKHPKYKSTVNIVKQGNEWITELNINNKNDKDNIKAF